MRRNLGSPARVLLAFGAMVSCNALGGCDQLPVIVPPRDLPPEVVFVVENKTRFALYPDDVLEDGRPAHLMEDPGSLSGCWGWAAVSPETLNGRPILEFFFLEVFDAEGSGYRAWFFQRDALGLMTTLSGLEGEFSVAEDDVVRVTVSKESCTVPTGNLDVTEFPEPLSWDLRVLEVAGDRMKIEYGPGGSGTTVGIPPRAGAEAVYERFDCPE